MILILLIVFYLKTKKQKRLVAHSIKARGGGGGGAKSLNNPQGFDEERMHGFPKTKFPSQTKRMKEKKLFLLLFNFENLIL